MAGRSKAYWEKDRTKPIAYEFPYQKTVKASVSCKGQIISTDQSKFDDFYDTDRHLPKSATLTSIDISTEGYMGTIKKASVNFTIHDIRDIGSYENGLLRPGTTVTINYGWSGDGKSQGGGEFVGETFNFGFSMNDYGGADCNLECLGPGASALWLSVNRDIPNGPEDEDEHGHSMIVNTIMAFIRDYIRVNREKSIPKYMINTKNGVGQFEINGGEEDKDEDSDSFSYPGWYISLGSLIKLMNKYCLYTAIISEDKAYEPINTMPTARYVKGIPSGNYLKFAFPNPEGYYNKKVTFEKHSAAQKVPFVEGDKALLGNALINIDYLFSIFERDIAKDDNVDVTVKTLFRVLFRDLSEVSGGAYNLALTLKPNVGSNNLWYNKRVALHIHDISDYGKDGPKEYTFTPFVEGSVVRNMSLSTQIPDLLVKEMYLVARGEASKNKLVNFMMDKSDNAIDQNQTSTNPFAFPLPVPESTYSGVGIDWELLEQKQKQKQKELQAAYEKIKKLKETLAEHNGAPEMATQLISANRDAVSQDPKSTVNDSIYPLNLSVTLDGDDKILPGDYITSGWLPRKYQKGLDFMVTKISHKITVNDWETDIETQCKVKKSS